MELVISHVETELRFVQALRAHFTTVKLERVQTEGIVWGPAEGNIYVWADKQHVFIKNRDFSVGLDPLSIDGNPEAEVPVKFLDTDGEVHYLNIYINAGGNLRAVLQNHWENRAGNGCYYSLLPHAGKLTIMDNLGAL